MPELLDTVLENRWLVRPVHGNGLGTAHGGFVLQWLDELGATAATRFAGENCVTAGIDRVAFERPIPVGDAAVVRAYVYDAGETSVRVRHRAFREDPLTGDREPTTESHAVYVAVDADGDPVPVPGLTVGSERGRYLRDAALEDAGDGEHDDRDREKDVDDA